MTIFDFIAPLYAIFFNHQTSFYSKIVNKAKPQLDISKFSNILDIGCGTGALLKVLCDQSLDVTGVDASIPMISQAKRKLKGLPIVLEHVEPDNKLPFEDKSFDLVISSYVVHGLEPAKRMELYREMKRISKEYVIIHDYNKNRALLTTIIEWLERGDYFNFIQVAQKEMNEIFDEVNKVNIEKRAAWYICK